MIFLGLDASTQSLSAILIDSRQGEIIAEESVNFGAELPHYDAPNGFVSSADGGVSASPLMWLDALDLVFQKLCDKGVELVNVRAVCGAGQQHASVYLNSNFAHTIGELDAQLSLSEQLAPTLTRTMSPIWMDNSTSKQCHEITSTIGSSVQVSTRTGSVATERFTGPQIRKFHQSSPLAYSQTRMIHLNSSFLASVLAGTNAPIDFGDGAGMNLMGIDCNNWDQQMLDATAPLLLTKLPPLAPAGTQVSKIASYFVTKYGFSPNCDALSWTGDNPASLVGMGAATAGKIVLSLGTSDTLFATMPMASSDPNGFGHVFGNPLAGSMSLTCFANGSLARERVKNDYHLSWDEFVAILLKTPSQLGNNGKLAAALFVPEITPRLQQSGFQTNQWQPQQESVATTLRALLEGQFSNMLLQTRWMNLDTHEVLLTGGASKNTAIAQIIADIFQAPVKRIDVASSVGLGAAILAAKFAGARYSELVDQFCSPTSGSITPKCAPQCVVSHLSDYHRFMVGLEKSLGY